MAATIKAGALLALLLAAAPALAEGPGYPQSVTEVRETLNCLVTLCAGKDPAFDKDGEVAKLCRETFGTRENAARYLGVWGGPVNGARS